MMFINANRYAMIGNLIATLFMLLPLQALAQTSVAPSYQKNFEPSRTISIEGKQRTYVLHIPATRPKHPALVLNFHGGGGLAGRWAAITGMNKVSDEHGFLVAYPQGLDFVWDDGGSDLTNGKEPRDDVLYLRKLIDDVASQVPIDRTKVFACGLSNGGSMTSRLALEDRDIIAGVAVVASGLYKLQLQKFKQPRPIPILFIEGTLDPCFPYNGGLTTAPKIPGTIFKGDHHGEVISNEEALSFWRNVNRCSGTPEEGTIPHTTGDDTSTSWKRWKGASGNDVAVMVVKGGGHCWPGGVQYFPVSVIGKTTYDFSASEAIWRFFANHGGVDH
jgi:polyhydroxybutyrate depolymerase